jgi:hypothetical protein
VCEVRRHQQLATISPGLRQKHTLQHVAGSGLGLPERTGGRGSMTMKSISHLSDTYGDGWVVVLWIQMLAV